MPRKTPKIIRREHRGTLIVHGIICQQSQRFAIRRFHCQHSQPGIHGTGRPGDIRALVAGMHIGTDRWLAKRVIEDSVRPADPATVMRMIPIIKSSPPGAGWLEIPRRIHDDPGDFSRQ